MFKKIVGLGFSSKGKKAKDVKKYIDLLVQSGATEFFTGYTSKDWYTKFGFEVSTNGRFAEHEQITDLDTLKEIVKEVHNHKLEIFGNLNSWYYTDETFPYIKEILNNFIEIGMDGIICGNIGILEYLKKIGYKGKINISTILALYNIESIKFILENYKINKIILSRELTLKEIEEIVNEFKDVKFEVFGEGDFCRYNNGLCFAEHKYGDKDICTVVVNDLIIKKRFKADFKKLLLKNDLTNLEKVNKLSDNYKTKAKQVEELILLDSIKGLNKEQIEKLINILYGLRNKENLFFDAMQSIESKKNKSILLVLQGLNYLFSKEYLDKKDKRYFILKELKEELEDSFKKGLKYNIEKIKNIGGKPKLKAEELAMFYARGDMLNLYYYLFFSKFKNIDTVKFPTRGRNYSKKLKIIEEVILNGKVNKDLLTRGISIERCHYDLTYLFKDKLWFRNMLKDIK